MKPHLTTQSNAHRLADWLQNRGGLVIWESHDLGNPGRSVTCPYRDAAGNVKASPGWQYPKPGRHITDPAEVAVETPREVARLRVRLKQAGMQLTLTAASSRKLRDTMNQHGEGAWYVFASTGSSQGSTPHGLLNGEDEAIVFVPDSILPLPEWLAKFPTADLVVA